jgi:hypothetical protein
VIRISVPSSAVTRKPIAAGSAAAAVQSRPASISTDHEKIFPGMFISFESAFTQPALYRQVYYDRREYTRLAAFALTEETGIMLGPLR